MSATTCALALGRRGAGARTGACAGMTGFTFALGSGRGRGPAVIVGGLARATFD